jgi:predicted RNase H-like HicB family nuclease
MIGARGLGAAAGTSSFKIEFHPELDGRWVADIPALPGVTAYARTKKEA